MEKWIRQDDRPKEELLQQNLKEIESVANPVRRRIKESYIRDRVTKE